MRIIKYILKQLRLLVLRNQREENISNVLQNIVKKDKKKITILDFGSGKDAIISKYLINKFKNKSFNIKIDCYDFFNKKTLKSLNKKNQFINFYDVREFYKNNKKYDYCLIIDVLHHVGVDNTKYIVKILKKLKKKSKTVIIKDHFEWSFLSRILLIFMDFIGNYHNDVSIPNKYFTELQFNKMLSQNKIKIKKKILNKRYHSKIFLFLSNPNFHFLYII